MIWRLDDMIIAAVSMDAPVDERSLTAAERGLCDAAPTDGRRRELVAGRAAFHKAWIEGATGQASLLHDASGRPSIEPPGGWFVSVAHDGRYALAALSRAPVGIDVVPLSRADHVRHVVARRIETRRARSLEAESERPFDEPAMLWTAWEALGKRSGAGVLAGPMMRSLRVERGHEFATAVDGDERVRWWLCDEHLICVAGERLPV